jgi:hypothetical protein
MNMTDINDTAARAGDALFLAQRQMENLGASASGKFDDALNGAADALENAAASFRETGRQGAAKVRAVAGSAAETLDSTADSVRSYDAAKMLRGVRHTITKYPAGAFLLAAGLGLLLGSAVRGRTNRRS